MFEAFDGEEWRQLYYHGARSPWPHVSYYSDLAHPVVFRPAVAADFASTRFRIRLVENDDNRPRCMHIRGLELYGTILPPWRVD